MTLCGHMSRLKHRTVVFTQSFAAALVGPELVALNAPALEPPLRVGTALTAVALLGTLVHIWNRGRRQEGEGQRRVGIELCNLYIFNQILHIAKAQRKSTRIRGKTK